MGDYMLELDISNTQLSAFCILIISIIKGCWDLFVLPWAKSKAMSANGRDDQNAIIKEWRNRDSLADKLAFLAIIALSAWLLALGFSQDQIAAQQLSEISARLDDLERRAKSEAVTVAKNGNVSGKLIKQD
jgi:hypothetical protein